jgi:catechol O-methyltransferase
VEFSAANAPIARRILEYAGVADRVTVVLGCLGDGGGTAATLESEHGFTEGSVDLVFLDHAKEAYLPDLQSTVSRGWLHPGSIVESDYRG